MTRVVVLGARGLLGSGLVPYLEQRGYELVLDGAKDSGERTIDLTEATQVDRLLGSSDPEVIVNLAALTDVDICEKLPQRAYLANVKIVENLVRWIQMNGKNSHLIQISTDQVYDGDGPHSEEDVTLTNYYGFSKYAGELAAAGVQSTVLRTNFFGPSRCAKRISFSDWLVQAMQNKQAVTVFDDVEFSPLSLSSLQGYIGLAIEQRRPGLFNLGSSSTMSKAQFALLLAQTLNLPTDSLTAGRLADVKLYARRPKNMSMNSNAFEVEFGVRLPDLHDEVKSMKSAYSLPGADLGLAVNNT